MKNGYNSFPGSFYKLGCWIYYFGIAFDVKNAIPNFFLNAK